ncbi:MAG: HAD family hydrolase [Candidatus Nanopelagicales bacterium]|nr:HAD family hydrolase [Candidatus Nanopelagicales bacterium]
MTNSRAVLFDLDGTITDSAPGMIACIRYALADMDLEGPDDDDMRSFLGPPLVDTFTNHFGLTPAESTRLIAKYRERYHEVGEYENAVYPGMPEILADLRAQGATVATATSKPTASATRILTHFGLDGYFTFIGGAEMHGARQHKADVIAHTLEELGIDDPAAVDIHMVGDRSHDVLGAKQFGIPTIGVLWGYGSRAELTAAGAVAIVDDAAQLRALLRL